MSDLLAFITAIRSLKIKYWAKYDQVTQLTNQVSARNRTPPTSARTPHVLTPTSAHHRHHHQETITADTRHRKPIEKVDREEKQETEKQKHKQSVSDRYSTSAYTIKVEPPTVECSFPISMCVCVCVYTHSMKLSHSLLFRIRLPLVCLL